MCWLSWNLGASTSWNPQGLSKKNSNSCKERGMPCIFFCFRYFLNNGSNTNLWCFGKHKAPDFLHIHCALTSQNGNLSNFMRICTTPTSVIVAVYIPALTENNTSFHILCLSSNELWFDIFPLFCILFSHTTLVVKDKFYKPSSNIFSMTHTYLSSRLGDNMKLSNSRQKTLGFLNPRVCGGAVGWGTALQARRSWVRFPMVSLRLFHWHNPSDRTMALGLTQPLTEMSTRNIFCG